MSFGHPRRIALAGIVAVAVAVVLILSDPFAGKGKPSGLSDDGGETSLATVTRESLSAQTQVSATLGYADAASIRVPEGTPPSAVMQAEQVVSSSRLSVERAVRSLTADSKASANLRAAVSAAREKEAIDCGGAASSGSPSNSGVAGECASEVQSLASERQSASAAATKEEGDRASLASSQAALASAESTASAARSTVADYGQGSTFTMLPSVGRVIARGQNVFALGGQSTVLMYGSLVPSRAFLSGMSPGRDVQTLNANLEALGYGTGIAGETFSAGTQAAIRALQSARGMAVTGELPLGSVVFEPGAVRVTSVIPEVGENVAPAPVLRVTSTRPQVTIALSAAQQSSVKVGDRVSISLPDQQTTAGVISSVGTVAKSPASREGGSTENGEEGGPTIEVAVTPSEPRALGHLDEAPVSVSITTASVADALAVPVDALLALAGGGYALEVVSGRVHHLEAVTLGLFDDAEGLVQVSGGGVSAGQRVVVPSP